MCVSEVSNLLPLDQCEEVWKDEGALVAGVHLLSHLLHGHHDQELHHSDGDSVMVDMMLLVVVVLMVVVVMVAVVMVVLVLVAVVVMMLAVVMVVGVMVVVQTTMRMTTTAIAATLGFSPICRNNLPSS